MPPRCPFCASARAVTSCPLAAELADEERMEFLTSHIAPGDLNARADLMSFWSRAVAHACEQASGLSFNPSSVAETLLGWSGATAPGLDLAIQDMVSSGALAQRSKIEEEEAGFTRWLVVTPLQYLAGAIGLGRLSFSEKATGSDYVHRDVLEGLAEAVVAYCQHLPPDETTVYLATPGHSHSKVKPALEGESDISLSPWCFEQLCGAAATAITAAGADGDGRKSVDGGVKSGGVSVASKTWMLSRLSKDDMSLLARYLVRTRRAVSGEGEEEGLLKIFRREGAVGLGRGRKLGSAAASAGSGEAILTISETEKDLLRLRGTVACLEASASDLGRRIQTAQQDARRERRQGQKRAALVHMRRMKQFQAARDKRLSSLYTLGTALDQVKQLRMDKQVLEAHQAATGALKACREAQGLTVERVEDTLDALAGEMAEHQAISAALAQDDALLDQDGSSCSGSERAELEAELDALLAIEEKDSGRDNADANAGTVPPSAATATTAVASPSPSSVAAGGAGGGGAAAAGSSSGTSTGTSRDAAPSQTSLPLPA